MIEWSQWRREYAANQRDAAFVCWLYNNPAQFVLNNWIGDSEGAD